MLADLTLGENGNEFRLSYLADRHRVLDVSIYKKCFGTFWSLFCIDFSLLFIP